MQMVEHLINELRGIFQQLPDARTGRNTQFAFDDIAMAAYSVFFMQCPSFLDHQRRFHEAENRDACQSLFGMKRIPSDNHIRKKLDAIDCEMVYSGFDVALEQMVQYQGLNKFKRLDDRVLIAIDGTQFHHSNKVQCPQCTRKYHSSSDTTSYAHSVLCATIVADGHSDTMPLRPEFITPQDGHEKQDCEQKAAHRWVEKNLPHYQHLRPVILGDALFSRQPLCQDILDRGGDFLFTIKKKSHRTLYQYLDGVRLEKKITHPRRNKGRGRETRTYRWHRYRLPIRNTDDALQVYWISVCIQYQGKTTYQCDFITSIKPTEDNIVDLTSAARARWKIENETFNILKNKGYHMEHNFGHGRHGLTNVLLTMNLIAFCFHTVCDQIDRRWQQARARISTRVRFFHTMSVLNQYNHYSGWEQLLYHISHPRAPP